MFVFVPLAVSDVSKSLDVSGRIISSKRSCCDIAASCITILLVCSAFVARPHMEISSRDRTRIRAVSSHMRYQLTTAEHGCRLILSECIIV